ncbi:hypothetical protein [Cupriavidus necator]
MATPISADYQIENMEEEALIRVDREALSGAGTLEFGQMRRTLAVIFRVVALRNGLRVLTR